MRNQLKINSMNRNFILSVIILSFLGSCKYFNKKDAANATITVEQQRINDSIKFANELNMLKEDSQKRIDSLNMACSNPSYTYYVITGSFKNPANAENYAGQMMNLGYKSHIITISNGFHLVSASSGDDLNQSTEALRNIQQTINQEAWLFVNK